MATIARAFATKDTWITEQSVTSNFGASPILETWTKFNSTDKLDRSSLLRYVQLMIELYPSTDLSKSPIIHEIQINH